MRCHGEEHVVKPDDRQPHLTTFIPDEFAEDVSQAEIHPHGATVASSITLAVFIQTPVYVKWRRRREDEKGEKLELPGSYFLSTAIFDEREREKSRQDDAPSTAAN